jgi:TonB family protein
MDLHPSDSPQSPARRAAEPPLQLLTELPPRHTVFFGNLRDLLLGRNRVRVWTTSPPANFWPDVFVPSGIGWWRMAESGLIHVLAVAALISFTRLYLTLEQQRSIKLKPQTSITEYQISEYLPPIDTGSPPAPKPRKGQPALAKQKIISLPPRPDNFEQTIISPVDVKLPVNIPLPNIVAWTPTPTPAVPTAAATRNPSQLTLPQLPVNVIPPPPDARNLAQNRLPDLAPKVVEPPPDPNALSSNRRLDLNAKVIEPPPSVDDAKLHTPRSILAIKPAVIEPPPDANITRNIGALNVGNLTATVAAPKIEVAQQRTIPRATSPSAPSGNGQPTAPAPLAAVPPGLMVGNSPATGQLIALNLQPANISGPVNVPPGRRTGEFAAGPEGKPGAPGTPDIQAGGHGQGGNSTGTAGPGKGTNNGLPPGIVIGNAPGAPPPGSVVVAGTPQRPLNDAQKSILMAAARPPRIGEMSHDIPPDTRIPDAPKVEDKIFGGKKSYQMALNMPNLNSTGGSWIMRFAQLDNDRSGGDVTAPIAMTKVDPAYPAEMMRDGIEGTVTLYAIIHKDGTVGEVRVLRGLQGRLDENARMALLHWRFRPGTKNGQAVDLEAVVQIPFRSARVAF